MAYSGECGRGFDSRGKRVDSKSLLTGRLADHVSKGYEMYLQTSDLFALTIALFAVNVVLVLSFRRVYVLEKQIVKLRRQLREVK